LTEVDPDALALRLVV